MGLAIVLLFWAAAGMVIATIGATVLSSLAALLTRGATSGRRRAIFASAAFPFACLAWAGILFVFQALVNEGLLHRDLGIGDGWHAPLQNGYQVLMIDVTDQGTVYNPKTQPDSSGVTQREDAIFGVRQLQLNGPYILGASDSQYFGSHVDHVDSYFILDTRSGKNSQFADDQAFQSRARELHLRPALSPIYSVYSDARFTWFDVFVGILLVLPPAVVATFIAYWIFKLRRSRPKPS